MDKPCNSRTKLLIKANPTVISRPVVTRTPSTNNLARAMGKLYFGLANSTLNALNAHSLLGERTVSVYLRVKRGC